MVKKRVVLETKQVYKKYYIGDQSLSAIDGISIKIYEADLVSIIGPSGSGKSTLLHLISLLDKPTRGELFIDQNNVTSLTEVERARFRNKRIGFIFQQFNLLAKTSAVENVGLPLLYAGLPLKERDRLAMIMLNKVGMGDRLHNTPAQLSGGQQQRVAIARSLVNDPAIIFADEPTGNLDSKSGEDIRNMLISLNKEGKTIVMVTHDQEMARIGTRVISIRDGRIEKDEYR